MGKTVSLSQYPHLLADDAPKMVKEYVKIHGTEEILGPGDNPIIMSWAKELGLKDYIHDSIAWCGLTTGIIAHRAGKKIPKEPLLALNWKDFGNYVTEPMLGDILVKKRYDSKGNYVGGHVCMYVGEDDKNYHCAGGNQGDKCNIVLIPKSTFIHFRRPEYSIGQPTSVKKYFISSDGEVSTKED